MKLTLQQWAELGIAAGMLLTGLLTLVSTLWLSRQAASQVSSLLMTLKARQSKILGQVDEPEDVFPCLVERYTGVPAPITSALLTALVRTALAQLDVPVREVNAGETAR